MGQELKQHQLQTGRPSARFDSQAVAPEVDHTIAVSRCFSFRHVDVAYMAWHGRGCRCDTSPSCHLIAREVLQAVVSVYRVYCDSEKHINGACSEQSSFDGALYQCKVHVVLEQRRHVLSTSVEVYM